MEMDLQEQEKVLDKLKKFLVNSSKNADEMLEQNSALQQMSGNFWDEDTCRKWGRRGRKNIALNYWEQVKNFLVGKFSQYPWHCSVDDNGIQEAISAFEEHLGTKNSLSEAFARAIGCGCGYLHLLFEDGNPSLEVVKNQTSVYTDPWAQKCDLSDSAETAIVNWISKSEAEEKYDVTSNYISLPNCSVWNHNQESIASIIYYVKNKEGVTYYKIVGDKVVESIPLPIPYIPVIRMAGYEQYKSSGVRYQGIVQRTYNIMLMANVAASQLYSRMNRTPRSLVAMSTQAMQGDGIREGLSKILNDSSFILPYNSAGGAPQILQESFQTADLTAVIEKCRQMLEDSCGVNLAGNTATDKTATEVLIQNDSVDSSLSSLYLHAECAMRTLNKIILAVIGTEGMPFKLENGPAVISAKAKERKQLAALISSTTDENAKNYLVAKYAATLNDPTIGQTLFSNLPADYKVVEDTDNEENMIQGLAREAAVSQSNYNEAISVADELSAELDTTKAEAKQLEAELNSNRESWNLEKQRIALDAQKAQMQLELKVQELQAKILKMEAETEQIKAETQSKQLDNAAKASEMMQPEAVIVESV